MHFKAIVALAAAVASVNADAPKSLQPAGNGALDLSGKGMSFVGKRAGNNGAVVKSGNVALHGATPFRSALDFNQISKPNPQKRAAPAAADDEPWVPEWQPGQEFVQEIPESEETSSPPAAAKPTTHDPHGQNPHGQSTPTTTPAQRAGATPSKPAQSVPTPQKQPPAGSDHTTVKGAAGSVTTPAPSSGGSTGSGNVNGGKGALTFNIVNKMSGEITISYQLGTYSPASGGPTTVASQLLGINGATTGTFAQSTQVVAPVGWAGRMTIGKAGAELDYRGTKIEGNNGFDGADPNADPDPDVDISYVDGYSVPASCSCGSTVLSGCNKELFDLGNTCDNLAGDSNHKVCVNEPRNAHGPASPFFAPCANAAYTYDYNDVANWQGTCAGNVINCCIGTDCPAPTRQLGGKTKREVMALMGARRRSAMAAA